jgi:diguanylate cyclase (GGDEF)-like protein/PAS domain S-box-containing protein
MLAINTILIAEDIEDDRLMLMTLLKGHGYKTVGAENGQDAMDKLAKQKFDLIISDILMPEMDGYRFCLSTKSDERYQKIPFVFYSATFTEDVDEALAKEVGADLFIAKPTDPEQFIIQIKNILSPVEKKTPIDAPVSHTNETNLTKQYNQSLSTKLAIQAIDLKASEIKYKALFETAQSAIIICDSEKLIDCNTTCLKLLGCHHRDQFIGTKITDWSATTQPNGSKSTLTAARYITLALREQKQSFEWNLKKLNGELFPASVELSSMVIDNQLLIQATVHDISQRKRKEQQEKLHKEVLRQLLDSRNLATVLEKIATGLEHEIPHTRCSILLADAQNQLSLIAAPSMPDSYQQAISQSFTESSNCLYKQAIQQGRKVIEHLPTSSEQPTDYKIMSETGFNACWLEPIDLSSSDDTCVIAIHFRDKAMPMTTQNIELFSFYVKLIEIAIQRYEANKQLNLANAIFQHSVEAMLLIDKDYKIITANPSFTTVTGYSVEEVIGKTPHILRSGRHDEKFYDKMWKSLADTGQWQGEVWHKRKNGEHYTEWLTITTIYDDNGEVLQRAALFSDITEKKKMDELLIKQANHDSLTKLPNRNLLKTRISEEITKYHRTKIPFAVLFADLDHFKEVNDSLGHDLGDLLLIDAAKRISECVRETDLLARLGGDEFTIVMTDLNNPHSVERVANAIIESLSRPFKLDTEIAYVSASIGIAFYPDDGDSIVDLLRHADQAMYYAKAQGKGRFCYFTKTMQENANYRASILNDLRTALPSNQLELYYQPIISLRTNTVIKAEALLRWNHPQRDIISPLQFIPIAEESGLIIDIGDWVFQQALAQLKHWRQHFQADFQVSINKSPVQFKSLSQHADWMDTLSRASNYPEPGLVVEITESLLLQEDPNIMLQFKQMQHNGVKLSLDDFGTGYSSLSYLNKFGFDFLKIDKSFTQEIVENSDKRELCNAIIVMAHALGIEVVAEGIETLAQQDLLSEMGCDYGQGYLYSKPVPVKKFEQILKNGLVN